MRAMGSPLFYGLCRPGTWRPLKRFTSYDPGVLAARAHYGDSALHLAAYQGRSTADHLGGKDPQNAQCQRVILTMTPPPIAAPSKTGTWRPAQTLYQAYSLQARPALIREGLCITARLGQVPILDWLLSVAEHTARDSVEAADLTSAFLKAAFFQAVRAGQREAVQRLCTYAPDLPEMQLTSRAIPP